jgi:hypothetical protein
MNFVRTTIRRLKSNSLRNLSYASLDSRGQHSIFKVVLSNEVEAALRDWPIFKDAVLIGGLAVSFYTRPRVTTDADFLFISESSLPDFAEDFKKVRPHAFRHNRTHVEIEVLTPSFLSMPDSRAKQILRTSVLSEGIRVASAEGVVCSKLLRWSRRDQADISEIMNAVSGDLTTWSLSSLEKQRVQELLSELPNSNWSL